MPSPAFLMPSVILPVPGTTVPMSADELAALAGNQVAARMRGRCRDRRRRNGNQQYESCAARG